MASARVGRKRAKATDPAGRASEHRELGKQDERTGAISDERQTWLVAALASLGDGVIATDLDQKVAYLNDSAVQTTGWGREDALGTDLRDVFRITDRQGRPAPMAIARVMRDRYVGRLAADARLISRSGTSIDVDHTAAPIVDERGNVVGSVIAFRDVTGRRVVERRLAEVERLAAASALVGGLAHEVNNPLTAVLGNIAFADTFLSRLVHRMKLPGVLSAEAAETRAALADGRRAPTRSAC